MPSRDRLPCQAGGIVNFRTRTAKLETVCEYQCPPALAARSGISACRGHGHVDLIFTFRPSCAFFLVHFRAIRPVFASLALWALCSPFSREMLFFFAITFKRRQISTSATWPPPNCHFMSCLNCFESSPREDQVCTVVYHHQQLSIDNKSSWRS